MNTKVVNQRTTEHKYNISYLYAGKRKLVMKIKQLQTQAIKTAVCMVALQLPCKFSSGQLSKCKKAQSAQYCSRRTTLDQANLKLLSDENLGLGATGILRKDLLRNRYLKDVEDLRRQEHIEQDKKQ